MTQTLSEHLASAYLALFYQFLHVLIFQLPEILKSIVLLQMDNEMPCFDPQDVIFITNKWDSIRSQLDVEKEKEKVWGKIKQKIKAKWDFVKEEHIFRMNCINVSIETNLLVCISN